MYHDFIDSDIRLSWGNISGYTLNNTYTPIGIQFEKNYSYGTGSPKTNQYYQTISVTEDSELLIVNEEGTEVLKRVLSPGNYRIKDFLLNNGLNVITIILTPLSGKGMNGDGSDYGVQTWTMQMAYDSQLLAYGDTLYGGSLSIGRNQIDASTGILTGAPALRVSPEYYYEYHFDDLALNYWQDIGLTDSLTLGYDVAVTTIPATESIGITYNSVFSAQLTQANKLGTTNYKVITGLGSSTVNSAPRFYGMLNHRFKMDKNPIISSLSVMIGYQNPSYKNSLTNHRVEASVSFGGALGFLRYSLSSSLNFETDYGFTNPEFMANTSFSFSPFKAASVSASISASKSFSSNQLTFTGSISASISFSAKTSASVSTNVLTSANANLYTRFGKNNQHYLQASVNNILFEDPANLNIGLGYSYSGTLLGFNFRTQVYNKFNSLSNSLSLSMSSAFADGVFTVAKSVGENYLLIKPTGSLKGSEIAVARSRDNSSKIIKTRFGTALYSDVSSNTKNSVVVYATGKDSFADTQTFAYELNPISRKAYVARISAQESYTATGIILGYDGNPIELFSSPVYTFVDKEDGTKELAIDSNLYLFTDQEGRFILSNLVPGDYFFDVQTKDSKWISVHFEVVEQTKEGVNIIEYEPLNLQANIPEVKKIEYDIDDNILEGQDIKFIEYLSGFEAATHLEISSTHTSEEFWNSLFPTFDEEEEFVFEELDTTL